MISIEDGVADSVPITCPDSSSSADANPLTRSTMAATLLPPLPSDGETRLWVDHAVDTVSGDSTIFLYVIDPMSRQYTLPPINVALLHPGDSDWTLVRKQYSSKHECAAYSGGKIVVCGRLGSRCILTSQVGGYHWRWTPPVPLEYRNAKVRTVDYMDNDYNSVANFAAGLLVLVSALAEEEDGKLMWVKRDGHSLEDRVLFLGWPCSFAVDATRFGMSGAGCAYFITKCEFYGGSGARRRSTAAACLGTASGTDAVDVEVKRENRVEGTQNPDLSSPPRATLCRVYNTDSDGPDLMDRPAGIRVGLSRPVVDDASVDGGEPISVVAPVVTMASAERSPSSLVAEFADSVKLPLPSPVIAASARPRTIRRRPSPPSEPIGADAVAAYRRSFRDGMPDPKFSALKDLFPGMEWEEEVEATPVVV
ncbi:hypothetical protein U9M48_036504 [Paspalum notatum var. saurae]|uniref:KIB1-4 beta-propeller domain-containing protein n=1 Tax=Paspalum notatum var. saurae TaxID=547442 RepID=A0AAQ3XB82_PASNO